ncbi:hypothetical protein Sjap_004258 [Stephania japonica]|uniref:non-specific serine/threonine protein kinase n=1 Tax=Stephania japonica TaxID=461633 RepID=A0AAP0PK50_9MAGN
MKKPLLTLFLSLTIILSFLPKFPSQTSLNLQLISLLSLKASLKDPLNTLSDWKNTNTNTNTKHAPNSPIWCSWSGVECDPTSSKVTSLDLSNRNLSGFLPPQLRLLSTLSHLNLSRNAFTGTFSVYIFDLPLLKTLDINHNDFNSSFPPGISSLKLLEFFNAFSNSFSGPLPQEISRLHSLQYLNLGGSFFDGEIQPSLFGDLKRLQFLDLAGNSLNGTIPTELGLLSGIQRLEIGYNTLSGAIPKEIGNLSNLTYLDISNNFLSGFLPPEIGSLSKLESLFLFKNHLTGPIPDSFSELKATREIDLSDNALSGSIPLGFSNLKWLKNLSLMNNKLVGEIPEGVGELEFLEKLLLWNNSLSGKLPPNLGSNSKLQKLDVSSNFLSGPLPPNLCQGNQLVRLILFSNQFDSQLPKTLANCSSLWRFRIENNRFQGPIPQGFGLLPNLTFMDVSMNNLSGEIPMDLGDSSGLEYLNLSKNVFGFQLPQNIWRASSLQIFSAKFSGIVGSIPDFVGCRNVYKIELDGNFLNGTIPWDISHCQKLIKLSISRNSLTGIIPYELSTLPAITELDLSGNRLSGSIPANFGNSSTIEMFNVSFNFLSGEIPASGAVFPNLHSSSFLGNPGLCGKILHKPCNPGAVAGEADVTSRERNKKTSGGAIVWIMAVSFGIGLFVLIAGTKCFKANHSRRSFHHSQQKPGPWTLTAFQRLTFTVDDVLECLNMSDTIIGMGSTGSVYKAVMPGGEIIAVKKLWAKQKETVMMRRRRGALAEVEVLGNVRHRNIVRLLACCTNSVTTLLLYEYMPNGSLDDVLHGKSKGHVEADWGTRYKIAVGVAQGMCYLHHDCDPPIVHRDVKPSNILLDAEMEARVADFGVAKLIESDEQSMSVIAGSYGYIAPEYAYTLQVDEKSDIYSYGVVLMEMLCGRRSVDRDFGEGNSIVDWVRSKIKEKDGLSEILDKKAGSGCKQVMEEMVMVMRIALLCTSRNPADRPSMREVIAMLNEVKPKRKTTTSTGGCTDVNGNENEKNSSGGNGGAISPLAHK